MRRDISRRRILFGSLGGLGALLGLRPGTWAQPKPAPPGIQPAFASPVASSEPLAHATTLTYDGCQQLVSIREDSGEVTTYRYEGGSCFRTTRSDERLYVFDVRNWNGK